MLKLKEAGVFDSSETFKNVIQTPVRTTKRYEIELYVYGRGKSVINGKEYTHQKGNLLFCPPGHKRYSKRNFVCYYVHIDIDLKTASLLSQVPLVTNAINYDEYKNLYMEIIKLYGSQKADAHFQIQSKLYELLDMIYNDSKLDSVSTPEAIKKAMDFMENNFRKQILLQDIAAHVNLSPTYFHKLFKSALDMTPQKYLAELRLNHAKMLLLAKNYSIEEVAERCGFSSLSYFDYQFKKTYGISPVGFRKQKYTM
jgi:AraC-like DNA-binding protein